MRPETSGRHDDMASTLGGVLKARREAEKLNITQLAAELGISRTYLSRLERGEYAHPSIKILSQIAGRLHIRHEDLYALTDYLPPTELPGFGPYLRAKHPEWPDSAHSGITEFYHYLKHKYSRP